MPLLKGYWLKSFFVFILLGFILSCDKKIQQNSENPEKTTSAVETNNAKTISFYSFENNTVVQLESLSNLTQAVLEPWTESIRVSGIALNLKPAGFLVNKLGVLIFDEDLAPSLKKFPYFLDVTTQDFFVCDSNLFFRCYKNSIFSKIELTPQIEKNGSPFLCQYDNIDKNISVIYNSKDLGLSALAQCTHLEQTGKKFLASFKTESPEKVSFDFFQIENLTSLNKSSIKSISKNQFQKLVTPIDIQIDKNYDTLLKTLISKLLENAELQEDVNLDITVNFAEKGEQKKFSKKAKNATNAISLNSQANYFEDNDYLQVLLPNGYLYTIKKDGDNFNFAKLKLPKLPVNFNYTYFTFEKTETGAFLIACWEENQFFYVGRSGLIKMPAKGLEPLRSCPQ